MDVGVADRCCLSLIEMAMAGSLSRARGMIRRYGIRKKLTIHAEGVFGRLLWRAPTDLEHSQNLLNFCNLSTMASQSCYLKKRIN